MNTPKEYVVKTKRWHCLFGILLAAGFLYLGLDIHFFHTLKRCLVPPNSPLWVIFSVVGFLLLVHLIRTFVSQKTLLKADAEGITIYSGNISIELGTKPANQPPRKGDLCLIPWNKVLQISRSKMLTGTQTKKGTGYSTEALGGTVTIGARQTQTFTKALQVLCDRSVKLQGFGTSGLSMAWNGYTDNDLRQMSKEDRESLPAESLNSGFLFRHSYLAGGLDQAIAVLEALREQYKKS